MAGPSRSAGPKHDQKLPKTVPSIVLQPQDIEHALKFQVAPRQSDMRRLCKSLDFLLNNLITMI